MEVFCRVCLFPRLEVKALSSLFIHSKHRPFFVEKMTFESLLIFIYQAKIERTLTRLNGSGVALLLASY